MSYEFLAFSCLGLALVFGAIYAFMVTFEAGYDAGYQSGKRNFKHGLYGDSNVIKN